MPIETRNHLVINSHCIARHLAPRPIPTLFSNLRKSARDYLAIVFGQTLATIERPRYGHPNSHDSRALLLQALVRANGTRPEVQTHCFWRNRGTIFPTWLSPSTYKPCPLPLSAFYGRW